MPIRIYTSTDGLVHDYVERIVSDSRGFLWFCSVAGLSRFDGVQFRSYGTQDGLPNVTVNDLLEDGPGRYWVATNGHGVALFTPTRGGGGTGSARRFEMIPVGDRGATNRVNVLYRDRARRIWAGTDAGLFWLDESHGSTVFHRLDAISGPPGRPMPQVWALLGDEKGDLWVGTSAGLVRVRRDGGIERHAMAPVQGSDHVFALAQQAGRLWIGHQRGVTVVVARPTVSAMGEAGFDRVATYTRQDGLAGDVVYELFRAADDRMWIGTDEGPSVFDRGAVRTVAHRQGMSRAPIRAFAEDAAGNLWMGRSADGAVRLAHDGLVTYDEQDGLGVGAIYHIFESHANELCVLVNGQHGIRVFDGTTFKVVRPRLPAGANGEMPRPIVLQDRGGAWWLAAGDTLYRYPRMRTITGLATTPPAAVYTPQDGIAPGSIRRLFEDSTGDIWIGGRGTGRGVLTRWRHATSTFQQFSSRHDLPSDGFAEQFAEDRAGNVWIGFWYDGLVRYRRGQFERVAALADRRHIRSFGLHVDRAGRLWIGTNDGVLRIDQPDADHLQAVAYSTAEGLNRHVNHCFAEDDQQRLYLGMDHGVNRLDPSTGAVALYGPSDGLAQMKTTAAFRDSRGDIWFGTTKGLSRLTPRPESTRPLPRALIGGVRIDGIAHAIDDLGQAAIPDLRLRPGRRSVAIDFFALAFQGGSRPHYQYRLVGGDATWNPPTDQRAVTYGHLAPGAYRFEVRTVSRDGRSTGLPAVMPFDIPPPLWERPWFVTLIMASVAALAIGTHRYRVSHVVALERVRVRIATDLHDDIGSNLSRIALLSGVTARQVASDAPEIANRLTNIADISQESVDAMSDIVWAIDPTKDQLDDLVRRMRRFASDLFTARGIAFRLAAPAADEDLTLDLDLRRELFLIFKEAVNNIVRHAGCSNAEVDLRLEGGHLFLCVQDDGTGFAEEAISDGNGLASMRRRARTLGGELAISSSPNPGTRVMLRVPLRRNSRPTFRS